MKVQEYAIAAEKHILVLELAFFMLVVNIDSLKRNISIDLQKYWLMLGKKPPKKKEKKCPVKRLSYNYTRLFCLASSTE
jgi:hypothetical protein